MSGGAANEEGEFGFQIAPMVDVVFVLLLFFMACAGQAVTEGLLKINLPVPDPTTNTALVVPLIIDIDPSGGISVNGETKLSNPAERKIPVLDEYLRRAVANDGEASVVVRPAPEARHERVIDVLNACRMARVKHLTFG